MVLLYRILATETAMHPLQPCAKSSDGCGMHTIAFCHAKGVPGYGFSSETRTTIRRPPLVTPAVNPDDSEVQLPGVSAASTGILRPCVLRLLTATTRLGWTGHVRQSDAVVAARPRQFGTGH